MLKYSQLLQILLYAFLSVDGSKQTCWTSGIVRCTWAATSCSQSHRQYTWILTHQFSAAIYGNSYVTFDKRGGKTCAVNALQKSFYSNWHLATRFFVRTFVTVSDFFTDETINVDNLEIHFFRYIQNRNVPYDLGRYLLIMKRITKAKQNFLA